MLVKHKSYEGLRVLSPEIRRLTRDAIHFYSYLKGGGGEKKGEKRGEREKE